MCFRLAAPTVISVLVAIESFSASAFEIRQVFKPERPVRGNVNLVPIQPIDGAAWIWCEGVGIAHGDYTPFVRFRTDFLALADEPLAFDVSADARFVLMLDGEMVAHGPHKGCVNHWYYETYVVKGLAAGEHRMEAVVFDPGEKGALSILSSGRNGFVLKAEGAYDAQLTTGKAKWSAAEVKTVRYGRVTDPETMAGAETISRGTGFADTVPAEADWTDAIVVRPAIAYDESTSEYGFHADGWVLFPTERPDPIAVRRTCGSVQAVLSSFDEANPAYRAEHAADDRVAVLQRLLAKGEPVIVPARTHIRFLWDLGDYYCAYPELDVAGGNGARIRWAWTEGLYDDAGTRGNRNVFIGKRVARSMDDTFICDGRGTAKFTTPWWRSGRWVQIDIETKDEPLELRRLSIIESRYPLEPKMRFACDDPSLDAVQRICVRGLQNCLHEMYMDCPYFEQQMYPGDTRVEMLVMNAISDDDRINRFGMGIFDCARRDDGLIPMNFPSRNIQDSATYSMCWATMFGDQVLWRGTNAWLKARLPGLRQTMSALAQYENDDGLVENLRGWSFVDWVPEWDKYGNAPDGRRGLSALNNLLYVMALQSAARTEAALGETAMAAYWCDKAKKTGAAIVRTFWNEDRGLVADTASKDRFSEHAQCLALLTDILPAEKVSRALKGLTDAPDLARTTVYFSHYLFDTYLKFARTDLFLKRLDLWRDYVKDGLKTPLEAPGWRGRSDCHAWGAHPLYHLVTGVAGIRPSENGYEKVLVAPQPGGLKFIKAAAPTPKGNIYVDLTFEKCKVAGTVVLPSGLVGDFQWNSMRLPLKSGINELPNLDLTKSN